MRGKKNDTRKRNHSFRFALVYRHRQTSGVKWKLIWWNERQKKKKRTSILLFIFRSHPGYPSISIFHIRTRLSGPSVHSWFKPRTEMKWCKDAIENKHKNSQKKKKGCKQRTHICKSTQPQPQRKAEYRQCQNVSEERIEYHVRVAVAPPSQPLKLRKHDAPYVVPIHKSTIIGKRDSVARFWENIAFAVAREDQFSAGFFCGSPKG